MTYLLTTFKSVSMIFAIAAVYTGAQAIINPIGFSKLFGLTVPPRTSSGGSKDFGSTKLLASDSYRSLTVSYISLMGVRQLATGVILITFASQGKWIEIATILAIIGVLVAGTDGYYLMRNGGSKGAGIYHAFPGVLIAALAWVVIYRHS